MSGKNLRLKSEIAPRAIVAPVGEQSLATVWVDNSLAHLDHTFSYLVPGDLDEKIEAGSLVVVPFNGQELSAVVLARGSAAGLSNLKSIISQPTPMPILSAALLRVITEVAKRYAAHPFDIVRSAIPARVASVEKDFFAKISAGLEITQANFLEQASSLGRREYLQLPPARDRSQLIAQKIVALIVEGGLLAIFPDSKELNSVLTHLLAAGYEVSVLDSQLAKSERYRNFLQVRSGKSQIVLGTRAAIFAPVSNLRNLLIINEGSEHYYEQRTPGWNVREVALIRTEIEAFNLIFIGYSPSLEVALQIENGEVELKRTKAKVAVQTLSQSFGELLPSRAVSLVRKALTSSSVLMVVPLKGYAQAIRCAHCKTISHCACGGAHEKRSIQSPITCNHCNLEALNWRCAWCSNPTPALISRGIERHLQEIAALFPGVSVRFATADHPIESAKVGEIVLATPGMAPAFAPGYQLVAILEGNRFLSQPDMRAGERVRELYFSSASLLAPGGLFLCIQDAGHNITTAVATWSFTPSVAAELAQRKALALPPFHRSVMLGSNKEDVSRLKRALLTAQEESRIPQTSKVLGPIIAGEEASLILTAPENEAAILVETIHEFMRRRSAAKKKLPSLRVDPYSLTH